MREVALFHLGRFQQVAQVHALLSLEPLHASAAADGPLPGARPRLMKRLDQRLPVPVVTLVPFQQQGDIVQAVVWLDGACQPGRSVAQHAPQGAAVAFALGMALVDTLQQVE